MTAKNLSVKGRQILWVAAGSLALAFLVAAASWLFSPRPRPVEEAARPPVPEAQVERRSFQPEGPAELPPPLPSPPPAPLEAAVPSPSAANAPDQPVEPPPAKPAPVSKSSGAAPSAPKGSFAVQLGAFSTLANARELQGRLKALGYSPSVVSKGGRHKVLLQGFHDRAAADRAIQELRKAGFSGAFAVPSE